MHAEIFENLTLSLGVGGGGETGGLVHYPQPLSYYYKHII
jgi:hypothetical protein